MQLGIASDVNNNQFAGAQNPDDLLHVFFSKKLVRNNFESEKEGRPIHNEVVYVTINTPGNQLNIIERPMIESDKIRFPRQWAIFKNVNEDGAQIVGTPLTDWPAIDRAEAEDLKALKFFTVEQIAGASDQQIQRLGMRSQELRQKANAFLMKAKDTALEQRQAAEIMRKDQIIADMQNQMLVLSQKLETLVNGKTEDKPKRKYTKREKPVESENG